MPGLLVCVTAVAAALGQLAGCGEAIEPVPVAAVRTAVAVNVLKLRGQLGRDVPLEARFTGRLISSAEGREGEVSFSGSGADQTGEAASGLAGLDLQPGLVKGTWEMTAELMDWTARCTVEVQPDEFTGVAGIHFTYGEDGCGAIFF